MAKQNAAPTETAPPGPFEIPVFRAIWFASMMSNLGGLIQSVGASWMMTSIAHSPTLVALVQASTTLPIMLLSLLAGAIADNLDRRRVMIAAQTFMLVVSALLSFFAWSGWLTPWLLLAFTFLIGIGTAFNAPSWQASVGDMVPRATLPAAVAMNGMGFNIARSIGPAIGGAIVAAAGAAAAFLVNAVSYVGLIFVLLRWQPARIERTLPPEPLHVAMGAGLRYVSMSPDLRAVILRAGLFGLAAAAVPALMPLVAKHLMNGGPLTYGALLGAFGIGAVAGAFGARRLRQHMEAEAIVRIATLALALGAMGAGVSRSLPATTAFLFIGGAGWVTALSTFNVTVQMASPRWVVGRSLALYQMAAFGGMALGAWGFGELAAQRGVDLALIAAGAFQLLSLAVGFAVALPSVSQLDLDPLSRWSEPDIAVPIEPRSGPIVITIEYRIEEKDVPAFLIEMAERRRIRIRDGARHWTMLRDLNVEELWIERYHVATWTEYVRHNQRRTKADAALSDRIRALHKGPVPFVVHRMIERQTGSLPEPQTREIDEGIG